MLSILTAHTIAPEVETIDRDPGVITLLTALMRNGLKTARAALIPIRTFHETASRLSFSATAWPRHR